MNRSNPLKIFLWTVAMQLASYAAHGAETRDPEVLAQRFVEAWNAHAPDVFTVALDSDADWINARGENCAAGLRSIPILRENTVPGRKRPG